MRSFVAAAALAVASAVAADESIVQTPFGSVQGLVFPTYRLFQGVPYANPPVGALRWSHSTLPNPWTGVKNATVEAAGCPQLCINDEPPHICPTVTSEDCLYMNIFTPRAANLTVPKPIIIFFHGGNFHDGYTGGRNINGGLLYDGQTYVEDTQAIIVTINYRLGSFGFLYLGTDVKGNFGLEDQMTAVRFIRAVASSFGGDPTRVTVMGQSAGAMSISCHMSRPQNTGLFTGAIMHSNPFGEPYRNVDDALSLAYFFANYTGCDYSATAGGWPAVETCLRALDTNTLLNAQIAVETQVLADLDHLLQIVVVWSPTTGTEYLPQRPMEAFQAGNVLDVPYMIGTTSNETVIFVYEALDFALSETLYDVVAPLLLGSIELFQESLQASLYPIPTPAPADFRVFASYLLTDGLFLCATRNATESVITTQPYRKSSVYHWQYSHQMSWSAAMWGANFTECVTEVCHGSDLPGWWHPLEVPAPGYGDYTPAETAMAASMHQAWANFAYTGNPNTGPFTLGWSWPAYDLTSRPTLNIEAGAFTVINSLKADKCAWWDARVGYDVY